MPQDTQNTKPGFVATAILETDYLGYEITFGDPRCQENKEYIGRPVQIEHRLTGFRDWFTSEQEAKAVIGDLETPAAWLPTASRPVKR